MTTGPIESPLLQPQVLVLDQAIGRLLHRRAEHLPIIDCQGMLVGGAGGVGFRQLRVGRVDHDRFRGSAEQLLWVTHQVLIERVLARHQHRHRLLAPAPGPPGLLAERRHGPGEGGDHGGVESADVDSQFQGIGGNDSGEIAAEEPRLYLATLLRGVAGSIGGD